MKKTFNSQLNSAGLSSNNRKILGEYLAHAPRSLFLGNIGFIFCIFLYLFLLLSLLFSAEWFHQRDGELKSAAVMLFISIFLVSQSQVYIHKIRVGRALAALLDKKHEESEQQPGT